MSKKEPKEWYAFDVKVDAIATEAVESAFNALGAIGTETGGFKKKDGKSVRVTGYFDWLPDPSALPIALTDSFEIYGLDPDVFGSITLRTVEEEDWLAEWKKYWRPTEVGRFIIAPPWETVDDPDKIIITIEPNMAFGTGTHETTQLCLEAIGELYGPDQSFLDVGTGTGILAIAAAKLPNSSKQAKAKIVGCDTDADAVAIARENAIANAVEDDIHFFAGPIYQDTPVFDFICANLTLDVILPILSLLIEKTRSVLVLSGILATQKNEILKALDQLQIADRRSQISGEWISVTIRVS